MVLIFSCVLFSCLKRLDVIFMDGHFGLLRLTYTESGYTCVAEVLLYSILLHRTLLSGIIIIKHMYDTLANSVS